MGREQERSVDATRFERHLTTLKKELEILERSGASTALEGLHYELQDLGLQSTYLTAFHTPYASQVRMATYGVKGFENPSFRLPREQESLVSKEVHYNQSFLYSLASKREGGSLREPIDEDVLAVIAFPDDQLKVILEHHAARPNGNIYRRRIATTFLHPHEWTKEGKVFDVVADMYDKLPGIAK